MTNALRLAEAGIARQASNVRTQNLPSKRRSAEPEDAPFGVRVNLQSNPLVRAATANADGTVTVQGFASVTESGYEMYDMFGPYTEVVSLDAFDKTLAASPLVEFTLNHNRGGGLPMAHTRNGTLSLQVTKSGETTGLWYEASVDPSRGDVADMIKALERGDLAEASFKFRIENGTWSPDYTEFRINTADLERGDVSAVNFGANPAATSSVRAAAGLERTVRALDPDDVNMLTQALALFAAVDNIVDEAQVTLSTYLGVANPDPDAEQEQAASQPAATRGSDLISPREIEHRTL